MLLLVATEPHLFPLCSRLFAGLFGISAALVRKPLTFDLCQPALLTLEVVEGSVLMICLSRRGGSCTPLAAALQRGASAPPPLRVVRPRPHVTRSRPGSGPPIPEFFMCLTDLISAGRERSILIFVTARDFGVS